MATASARSIAVPPAARRGPARRALAVLAALVLVAAWWWLAGPSSLGGPVTPVVLHGTSMLPTHREGDLLLVRRASSYERGDVVAFRASGGVVVHRVVTVDGGVLTTRGDNRDGPDPWRPTADRVLGRVWVALPSGGAGLRALHDPLPLAALAGLLTFLVALAVPRRSARPAGSPPVGPRPAPGSDPPGPAGPRDPVGRPATRWAAGVRPAAAHRALPWVLLGIQTALLTVALVQVAHGAGLTVSPDQLFLQITPADQISTYTILD